jgi:hypothetical protein
MLKRYLIPSVLIFVTIFVIEKCSNFSDGNLYSICDWSKEDSVKLLEANRFKNPTVFNMSVDSVVVEKQGSKYYLIRFGKMDGKFSFATRVVYLNMNGKITLKKPPEATASICNDDDPPTVCVGDCLTYCKPDCSGCRGENPGGCELVVIEEDDEDVMGEEPPRE